AAPEELEALDRDLMLAAALALLVRPLLVAQTPLDQHRPALRQVLIDGLSRLAERRAVDEAGFFLLVAVAVLPLPAHGDAELAHGGIARRVRELRVTGQMPRHDDPIEVWHWSSWSGDHGFPLEHIEELALAFEGADIDLGALNQPLGRGAPGADPDLVR